MGQVVSRATTKASLNQQSSCEHSTTLVAAFYVNFASTSLTLSIESAEVFNANNVLNTVSIFDLGPTVAHFAQITIFIRLAH